MIVTRDKRDVLLGAWWTVIWWLVDNGDGVARLFPLSLGVSLCRM